MASLPVRVRPSWLWVADKVRHFPFGRLRDRPANSLTSTHPSFHGSQPIRLMVSAFCQRERAPLHLGGRVINSETHQLHLGDSVASLKEHWLELVWSMRSHWQLFLNFGSCTLLVMFRTRNRSRITATSNDFGCSIRYFVRS